MAEISSIKAPTPNVIKNAPEAGPTVETPKSKFAFKGEETPKINTGQPAADCVQFSSK